MEIQDRVRAVESKIDINSEHINYMKKNLEAINTEQQKTNERQNKTDIIITKWVNYLYGLFTVLVTCCGVFVWSGIRVIDNDDKLNQAQDIRIQAQDTHIIDLDRSINKLTEQIITLEKREHGAK